ncbi:MAG: hypothetical protein ABIQ11_07140, partial [Saprospiraceae bacterium]
DSLIYLKYSRNEIVHDVSIKSYTSGELNKHRDFTMDTSFQLLAPDIAYINHGSLKKAHLPGIWEAMKSTKGLIIDIRNYPLDFAIYELSNYLMPESFQFVKSSNGSISHPGLFTMDTPLVVGQKNNEYYKGKVVILINEKTQS